MPYALLAPVLVNLDVRNSMKTIQRMSNWIVRAFYWWLFTLSSGIFFTTLQHYIVTAQFSSLAIVCGPVLALLFGFTSLLYGRTRAFPAGREQRRSLYAAERALQSVILFMVAIALGTMIALPLWLSATRGTPVAAGTNLSLLYWFFFPIILTLYSFGCFFFALRAVAHRLFRWVPVRELARRVKHGL